MALAVPISASAGGIDPPDLHLVRWPSASTSFSQPIAIRNAGDGSDRVFVIERCSSIRVVKNGVLLPTPFVSISASCGSEQGILGLAFDPDYATNGTFYVSYSAPSSDPRLGSSADHVLARYTASPPSSDVANPTGTVILRTPDIAGNHNGGDLHFGQDGYLVWSIGDGGAQGDPNGFAQCTGRKKQDSNPSTCHDTSGSGPNYWLLGKIVRLDVHNTTASATNLCGVAAGQPAPYAIPPANPFFDAATHPDECAEIYNWGFRNPFRFSIDRKTGDMLIGDVGQNAWEEVSFQAAGSPGQNFQWKQCEGFHTYPGGVLGCTGPAGSIPPKLDYSHSLGCAVTGGNIYRGPIVPLQGQYIFSDSCSGDIYVVGNAGAAVTPWTFETLAGTPSMSTYAFGEDEQGNLYVADGGGKIYRFESAATGLSWTVTPAAGVGGSLAPPTPQTVADGETIAFTVTAESGYEIGGVSGCGGNLAGNVYTTAAVTADCTVTATFVEAATFIVTPNAGTGGSLSPSTPQSVLEGDTIAFTVTPDAGYLVDSVSGCGGNFVAGIYTTAPVSADCTVSATFVLDDVIFADGFDGLD
jgi:glucose/arabinose dehydrogenase